MSIRERAARRAWLWEAVGRYRLPLTGAIVASVVAGSLTSLGPVVQKVIVDDVITEGTRPLIPWLAILVGVGLASFVMAMTRRYLAFRFSMGVQDAIRMGVYSRIHDLDARAREGYQSGDLFARSTADITLLQGVMGRLHLLAGHVFHLITAFVAMALLSVPLTLMVACFVPIFAAAALRMRKRLFPSAWYDQQRLAEVTSVVGEAVLGLRIIKAFIRDREEFDRFVDTARHVFRSRLRTTRLDAFYTAVLEVLPALAQVGVVAFGGWMVMRDDMTIGTFIAFTTFVSQMLRPVRSLAMFMTASQQARAGLVRIGAIMETPRTVEDLGTAAAASHHGGAVEFDDVTFGYDPQNPVLRGFSLRVEPGERVALVGLSGSGKSTAARLLLRMYDVDAGTISLDGVPVEDLPLGVLRRQIGGVIDEPFLFSSTLGENIAFGREDVSADEIASAAEIAGLGRFVAGLPDGYDTVVGERGLTLSGGQRQRLVLARAIAADPHVLVLDDATSAIDARTESTVFERLTEVTADRTTIVIAHRRSTLRLVDRIVVLDEGRVVADGTAAELLGTSETFRSIWGGESLTEAVPVDDNDDVLDAAMQAAVPGGMRGHRRGAGNVHAVVVTESLLEAVDTLPELTGEPDIDLMETRPETGFGLRSIVRPFRPQLLAALVLVAASAGLALLTPMLIRHTIDEAVEPGNASALFASTALLLAVAVVAGVLTWMTTSFTARTSERMLFLLRTRSFRHLLSLPLRFFDRESTGRIIARMTADVDALAVLLQQGLVGVVVSSVTALGVVVVLLVLDWQLALAVFTVLIPLGIVTVMFRRRASRAHERVRTTLASLYSGLAEGIEGVTTTQTHVREEAMIAALAQRSDAYTQARIASGRLASWYFPAVQFLSTVAVTVVLGVGAVQIRADVVSVGLLLAFLLYVEHLFRPMQDLSEQLDQWTSARIALGKISDLLEEPAEETGAVKVPHPGQSAVVELDAVTFVYPGFTAKVLEDVDLRIEAGETVAIVGESGAGKSSLAKLVLAFYETSEGVVAVDGVDLSTIDRADHRRRVGYVQQEPLLFDRSIRENIAYGRPDATLADVQRVAEVVGVHDTIAALPEGYDTVAGAGGRSLSMGERQLICLARALLVDPGLLILDEATANLDLRAEARVQEAMRRAAVDRTTIMIAHRLQTVVGADRIVVISEGRVVEQGSHDELVAAGGTYARLWETFADANLDQPTPAGDDRSGSVSMGSAHGRSTQ